MKHIDADKQAVKEITKTVRKEITSQVKEAMDSLNEKIAKASKSWKGVDVDKFMDEVRGREPDKGLEEAAEEYATTHLRNNEFPTADRAFIAGAKWQAEQDDRDVVFWKGMQYAIKGMKEDAVEGVIIDSGFDDGTAFVTMNIPDRRYDRGDKVRIIVLLKEDDK